MRTATDEITPYVPRPPRRYDLVGSTQDVARDLVTPGVPASQWIGAVVTARRSTAARGRQGRAWHVPPGANVCLTTVLPPVPAADAWRVALLAGVAVAEGIRAAAPPADARLRFPNDVLLGGRKAAGVLVETVSAPDSSGRLVPLLGIGVNVRAAAYPPEVAVRAVSLEDATGAAVSVEAVESALLARLAAVWESWRTDGFGGVRDAWTALADPDARRTFHLDGRPVVCRVAAPDADGWVTLTPEDGGEKRRVHAAQVILGDD